LCDLCPTFTPSLPLSLISFKHHEYIFLNKSCLCHLPPPYHPLVAPPYFKCIMGRAPIACIICLFKGWSRDLQCTAVFTCTVYMEMIKKTSSQIFLKPNFLDFLHQNHVILVGLGHRSHNLSFIQIKI